LTAKGWKWNPESNDWEKQAGMQQGQIHTFSEMHVHQQGATSEKKEDFLEKMNFIPSAEVLSPDLRCYNYIFRHKSK